MAVKKKKTALQIAAKQFKGWTLKWQNREDILNITNQEIDKAGWDREAGLASTRNILSWVWGETAKIAKIWTIENKRFVRPPVLSANKDNSIVERWIQAPIESQTATAPTEQPQDLATIDKEAKELLLPQELKWVTEEIIRRWFNTNVWQNVNNIRRELQGQWLWAEQIEQVIGNIRAEWQKASITWQATEAITKAEDIFKQDLERETTRIREKGQKVMDTTQRLNSLRWAGRSTANEADIQKQQGAINDLIATAEANADLKLQQRKMQIEWASSEAIASINESLALNEKSLNERLTEAVIKQKELDRLIGADFQQWTESLVWVMAAAWIEVWDFDQKATEALGYISDSKWRPLKLDAEWNPIAPKNQFWMDAKISNFKDANDNTYVYTNWELTSIIDLQGNILTGDQLKTAKVPAQVVEDKTIAERRKVETSLRNEFVKRPETKRFQEIRAQFERVKQGAAADSAAWDIALVFSFMKMLDPWSVVRESEFATAENAQGVPQQIINGYNKLLTGKRFWDNEDDLAIGLRADMLQRSKDLFDSEIWNFNATRDSFSKIAEDAGARPEFIFTSWEFGEIPDQWIEEVDTQEIDDIFWGDWWTEWTWTQELKSSSWKSFKLNFNKPDSTGWTNDTASFIKEQEGFSANPYSDFKQQTSWYWTKARPWETSITEEEANKRLVQKISEVDNKITQVFWKELTWSQRTALTSFMFNLWTNIFAKPESQTLKNAIINWDEKTIREQFVLFNKAWGKKLPWLVKRRERELKLLLNS